MSLSGALNSAVSGLNAQASALAMIATNLANSSTTGYKSVTASFSTMLNGGSATEGAVGGVRVAGLTNVAAQGLPMPSSISTNMAIQGAGFFVTTSSPGSSDFSYTRNGEFDVDPGGNIANGGQYLQGWPTDAEGNIIGGTSAGSLEAMNINDYSTIAGASTKLKLTANLPANAVAGATFPSTFEIFDSLGTAATVNVTWTKGATANTWTATLAAPVDSNNPTGPALGALTPASIAVTFNSDGTIATPTATTTMAVTWNNGAAASSIALDLGTPGTQEGLTQFSLDSDQLSVALKYEQNGVNYGSLESISIKDGTVWAKYDNGRSQAIYRVPVAIFANPNGLSASSGGLYAESPASGPVALGLAGQDGAGSILGASLEMSTTDTNKEFANMMAAQQAYSGNAQVMTAANDMFDTLIGAVR